MTRVKDAIHIINRNLKGEINHLIIYNIMGMLIRKHGITTSVTIFTFLVAISANLILYNKRDVKSWHLIGLISVYIMAIINKTTLMMTIRR